MEDQDDDSYDCHGVPVMGTNDDCCWWGTENAWMILGDPDTSGCDETGKPDGSCDGPDHLPATPFFFEGHGYLRAEPMSMNVIASNEKRVRDFALGIGAMDLTIQKGEAVTQELDLRTSVLFIDS